MRLRTPCPISMQVTEPSLNCESLDSENYNKMADKRLCQMSPCRVFAERYNVRNRRDLSCFGTVNDHTEQPDSISSKDFGILSGT